MKRSLACGAAAMLYFFCLASVASGRTMAPAEQAPTRALKGIEVAGAAEVTPVKPKDLFDWVDAIGDTVFGECTWGNCCGAGCDCTEDSDAKDRLDRACRAHDVCYGGDEWTSCDATCRCDGELADKAEEYAGLDCDTIDYADCEEMKGKAEPIAAAMRAKLDICSC
jgi:hypothetical protein